MSWVRAYVPMGDKKEEDEIEEEKEGIFWSDYEKNKTGEFCSNWND